MTRLFLLPLLLVLAVCGTDSYDSMDAMTDPYAGEAYADDPYASTPYQDGPYQPVAAGLEAAPSAGAQRVTIMDRGLQMPRGTQLVPQGWTLAQDLATDPTSGQPVSQTLDVRGPRGELLRNIGLANYGQMVGTSFQQAWRQLAMQGLQGEAANVSIGEVQRSATMESFPQYRKAVALTQRGGFRAEALEAPFQGSKGGQAVRGVVYVVRFSSPQLGDTGAFHASLLLSPADLLAETLQVNEQMAHSYQPNPQFEQRLEQINQAARQRQSAQHQQWMANSQAQHQQRMAANQASFDAHQQRMQGLSAANDQQFQSWQNQQRSGDEMHRRTINGINETVDLYDSNTGQSYYGAESGYDSYWTDPSGNVVGTQGYDNPDPMQYNQATDYDDVYNQGGYDNGDGW